MYLSRFFITHIYPCTYLTYTRRSIRTYCVRFRYYMYIPYRHTDLLDLIPSSEAGQESMQFQQAGPDGAGTKVLRMSLDAGQLKQGPKGFKSSSFIVYTAASNGLLH